MKKGFAILLALLLACCMTCVHAERNEFDTLSNEELLLIYKRIRQEVEARGLKLSEPISLTEGRYIIGQDIEPGKYVITCTKTDTEDLSRTFESLGTLYDGLDSSSGTSYSDLFSSLGSLYSAIDEGVKIEIVGDYGSIIKSIQLKNGECATLILEGKVALKITGGSCELELQ